MFDDIFEVGAGLVVGTATSAIELLLEEILLVQFLMEIKIWKMLERF